VAPVSASKPWRPRAAIGACPQASGLAVALGLADKAVGGGRVEAPGNHRIAMAFGRSGERAAKGLDSTLRWRPESPGNL
jgi:hypothetical protein